MKNFLFFLLLLMGSNCFVMAQCPAITCPSTLSLPCSTNGIGQNVTATSNYSANITSSWYAFNYIPLVSSGTATSVVNINCPGTYIVKFKDNLSNCVTTQTIVVTAPQGVPVFSLASQMSSNAFTLNCNNAPIDLEIVNAQTSPPGGVVTYGFGKSDDQLSNPSPFTIASTYTINSCGNYYTMVKDNASLCISSFSIGIKCPGVGPSVGIRSSSDTVCVGFSSILTATGATSYYWNTGDTTATIAITPTAPATYYVTGYNANGCSGGYSITAINCGSTTVTFTTGLKMTADDLKNLCLFPNPSSGQLKIQSAATAELNFSMIDIVGKEILKGSFREEKVLDLSELESGVYLFKFEQGNAVLYRKITVEN